MLAAAVPHATGATLSQWLRLLWDIAPPLHFDSGAPCIAGGAIHLPRCACWRDGAAAAAHAAAHLVYSPTRFDGNGLAPIARSLAALLEDARVESLAMRELPGLTRLWRPLHTATPALGGDFESLMARLARALVDPRYEDGDAWVRKGRMLFYLDAELGLLALRTPAEVRHAAMLLGNDIGQMRLQFNSKTYRPEPTYRDDHRWMWQAEAVSETAGQRADPRPPEPTESRRATSKDESIFEPTGVVSFYPEWDRLISRVRPDWVRVVEHAESGAETSAPSAEFVSGGVSAPLQRRLRGALSPIMRSRARRRLLEEGDALDLAALVDWRAAFAARRPGEALIYRGADRGKRCGAAMLLIDQSASTAASHGTAGASVLRTATQAAAAMAGAFESLGIPCCVAGFESRGRQAVNVRVVKPFERRVDDALDARLAALRPGGSTRLGAALRHATRRLEERRVRPLWLFVLSDGEPHDVDVHDPKYLPADARRAVRDAVRRDVMVRCVVVGSHAGADVLLVFGARRTRLLTEPGRLAQAIRRCVA
jgi:nitric oxide reductase NorD protein